MATKKIKQKPKKIKKNKDGKIVFLGESVNVDDLDLEQLKKKFRAILTKVRATSKEPKTPTGSIVKTRVFRREETPKATPRSKTIW